MVSRRIQHGFTYLTALFAVAILATGLALTGELWHTTVQREKEAELLFVGRQYRRAIERYYLNGPRQYPRTLEDLLKDPRKPTTERYLRRLYHDPITGRNEWGLVRAPDGGILGVRSLSDQEPLKVANFHLENAGFEAARRYSDWTFVYLPGGERGRAQQPGPAAQR